MNRLVEYFGHEFEELISAKELEQIVLNMAEAIEEDVFDKQPIFLGVMNGSFRFLNDLFSHFSMACEVDFIKCQSYKGTESTGTVKEIIGIPEHIKGRTVVIVEDIVDTGRTITQVYNKVKALEPEEIRIATLFFKPEIYTGSLELNYVGKEIEDHFIIGYGLDIDGYARNLNTIYKKIDSVSL